MRAALLLAVALAPALASAFEIGAEASLGGTVANNVPLSESDSSGPTGGSGAGVFVEQSFHFSQVPSLSLDLWADVLSPLQVDVFGGNTAGYLPIDLGLRAGYLLDHVETYVGALTQLAVLIATPDLGPPLNAAAFGVGGDVGVDFAMYSFRVGLEFRVARLLTAVQAASVPAPEQVWEFTGLLSFRYLVSD